MIAGPFHHNPYEDDTTTYYATNENGTYDVHVEQAEDSVEIWYRDEFEKFIAIIFVMFVPCKGDVFHEWRSGQPSGRMATGRIGRGGG